MKQSSPNDFSFKVVLLGKSGVGKTRLINSYLNLNAGLSNVSSPTVGASFFTNKIETHNGQTVTLQIWDTAGQEKFHSLAGLYYKDAHAVIIVYDLTDDDSFRVLQNWIKEIQEACRENVLIILAGNKLDLINDNFALDEKSIAYAHSVKALMFLVSAKSRKGVDKLFDQCTNHLLDTYSQQVSPSIKQEKQKNAVPRQDENKINLSKSQYGKQYTQKSLCCGGQ